MKLKKFLKIRKIINLLSRIFKSDGKLFRRSRFKSEGFDDKILEIYFKYKNLVDEFKAKG